MKRVKWERDTSQMSDLPPSDDEAVSLGAGHDGVIRFGVREHPYADGPYPFLDYAVEIRGGGVQASVLVRSFAGDNLPGFLRDLAADFRG